MTGAGEAVPASLRSTAPRTFTVVVATLFAGMGSDSLPPTPTATVCVPSWPVAVPTVKVTVAEAPEASGPRKQNSLVLSHVPSVDVVVTGVLKRFTVLLGTCVG